MLAASIHEHAGLGNQLWRYVCCRVFAENHGYEFGVSHPGWRGKFLNIDWGREVPVNIEEDSDFNINCGFHYLKEEWIDHATAPGEIGDPDPRFKKIEPNTYINGTFQKMSYIEEHRDKIREWLSYDKQFNITDYSHENVCVIQLRGGDYTTGHSMLPPDYYHFAMDHMRHNNPSIQFVIVTDDPKTAQKMIPNTPIVGSAVAEEKDLDQKHIGWYEYTGGPVYMDYSILNNAKYAIISSSTFAFWPVWLNEKLENVIAPQYWFDWSRSDGWWRPKDGIVNDDRWLWLNRYGLLYESKTCKKLAKEYYG